MQSIFRLPWSTEPPGLDKVPFQRPRQMPVVDIPMLNKLKRKRTDSPEAPPTSPASAHLVKKWKCAHGEAKPPVLDLATATATATATVESQPFAVSAPTPSPAKIDRKVVATAPNGKENVRPKSAKPAKEALSAPPAGAPVKPARASSNGVSNAPKPTASALPAESHATTADGCMTRTQQVLEQEFNLAILLKHDELRLIEQELAKCQVALEQLRRCHLVPFPGASGLSENVSLGVGPALKPQPGYTRPEAPVPWGVADGPYTRHYAKWLIPDPKFDSVPRSSAHAYAGMHYYGVEGGRSTRGTMAYDSLAGKSRGTRTSNAAGLKLQGLGDNPPPAPKIDPLIHKRSTDGQWVKLYCAECKSDKFSNTQGFLNHCRIKHNLVFKSHDAAAIACGIPIDIEEVTQRGTVALPQTATNSNASASANKSASTSTSNNGSGTTTSAAAATGNIGGSSSNDVVATPSSAAPAPVMGLSGSVHPLIKATPTPLAKPIHQRRVPPPKAASTPSVTKGPIDSYFTTPVSSQRSQTASGNSFVASPQTPYMSELLAKRGFLGNLQDMVADARTKIDLDSIESPASEDESAHATPIGPPTAVASGARLPASFGGIGIQRPGSQKGQQQPQSPTSAVTPSIGAVGPKHFTSSHHHLPPALHTSTSTASSTSAGDEAEHRQRAILLESPIDLSPNTVESNPGLVSDREDDDDESDDDYSDSERSVDHAAGAMMDVGTGGGVVERMDIVVEDGSDVEGARRKGVGGVHRVVHAAEHEGLCAGKAGSPSRK
jgi:ADA HAT complex component 1